MKPIDDGLEVEYGERLTVLRLNAQDKGRDAFVAYDLRGHPSFVIIDSTGRVLWKAVGQQSRSHLETAIHQALRGG